MHKVSPREWPKPDGRNKGEGDKRGAPRGRGHGDSIVVATSLLPERISGPGAASGKPSAGHVVGTGNTVPKPTWRNESLPNHKSPWKVSSEDAVAPLKQRRRDRRDRTENPNAGPADAVT